MEIVNSQIEDYLKSLVAADDEPVLLEMEELALKEGFPIVERLCGRFLEIQARMVGAKRVFELGSGYGYSAYWFSRALGSGGELHLTDMDEGNRDKAIDFLGRAGLLDPVTYHIGDALGSMDSVDGEFDVVYCDIDKNGYPDAWRKGKERVRLGGLYMCDNMLWSGRVTGAADSPPDVAEGYTEAVVETNRMIFSDPDFRAWINPTRDGVVAALRIR